MNRRGSDAPQYVSAHAHDRLAADERLAALDVTVRVVGDKVFLSGAVNTAQQRDVAYAVLCDALPGYEVHNELELVECAEGTPAQTESLT